MAQDPQASSHRTPMTDRIMNWLFPISVILYIAAIFVHSRKPETDFLDLQKLDFLAWVTPAALLLLAVWFKHMNKIVGILVSLLVLSSLLYLLRSFDVLVYIIFILPLLLLLITFLSELVRNAKLNSVRKSDQPKNIVVCIDGTWNYPGQKDGDAIANTNVYKFFDLLNWEEPYHSDFPFEDASDQHKVVKSAAYQKLATNKRLKADCFKTSADGRQIALYYNGVGNAAENTALGQTIGGAFGHGATQIMFEAFTDLVELYQKGDQIYILGFSRGAAISRMLANQVNKSKMAKPGFMRRVINRIPLLPYSFPEGGTGDPPVKLLAVWDTVAAFGLAKNILGIPFQRINLFKDFNVSSNVKNALHMLSVDDRRDAFLPTMMNPDPERITQIWFPGIHSDVGGGYAACNLSDISFEFLIRYILIKNLHKDQGNQPGLRFRYSAKEIQERLRKSLKPDPNGQMHNEDSPIYEKIDRPIPSTDYVHESVIRRVLLRPLEYQPGNIKTLIGSVRKDQQEAEQTIDGLYDLEVIAPPQVDKAKAEIERLSKLKIWYDRKEFREILDS